MFFSQLGAPWWLYILQHVLDVCFILFQFIMVTIKDQLTSLWMYVCQWFFISFWESYFYKRTRKEYLQHCQKPCGVIHFDPNSWLLIKSAYIPLGNVTHIISISDFHSCQTSLLFKLLSINYLYFIKCKWLRQVVMPGVSVILFCSVMCRADFSYFFLNINYISFIRGVYFRRCLWHWWKVSAGHSN